MPLSKVSVTSLWVHLLLSTDSNCSDTPLSRDAVVAKERCMWSKAFLRSSCATKKGVFHSFASSLARSRTTTHCEATVLRRKSVWNELNCVSPIASNQKMSQQFSHRRQGRDRPEFRLLGRSFCESNSLRLWSTVFRVPIM